MMDQAEETPLRSLFADILVEAGIDHVFGIPGGCTPFLFDGLIDKQDQITTVLARHEGGAAVMADVHARITGKPAVVMGQGPWIGTSGGIGIIEALHSGLPMLVICDVSDYFSMPQHSPYQSGSGEYGSFDLPGMMKAMTKYTTVASNASEFLHGLQLAIKHATTGRPGPAAVLVKWNVPFATADPDAVSPRLHPLSGLLNTSAPCISPADADRAVELLLAAKSPVLVAGQGVRSSQAFAEVEELAELIGIPVATSFLGKSAIRETHDCAVGTMGAIGQKVANQRITGADVILAVGSTLAPDNTKWLSRDFIDPQSQKIIQIDIETLNAGWTFPVELGITSDAKLALRAIIERIRDHGVSFNAGQRIEELKKAKTEARCFDDAIIHSDATPIAPERVVKEINQVIGEEDLLVLDGGNNRMWFTHHFQCKKAGQVLAGGGVAAVGYGPPASLAAQLANPGGRVICAAGDGGMMMHFYALEMARDLELPVTFVILNNSCLGNVRDFLPVDRRIATDYSRPDFASIARGFSLESVRIEKPEELGDAIKKAHESHKPSLVEVIVDDLPHFKLMDR
jgi:acetolactate synthase-1/2/3 large subunit